MITAYLVGITTCFEDEDIEIRFSVFKDQELLFKEKFFKGYKKPLIVEHVALLELLKRLEAFKGEEMTVVINNASLYEQIRGTSTLKNKNAVKMATEVRKKLKQFGKTITIKDVSKDKVGLREWNDILDS